eukprot:3357507-Lingulodinium_polyedra.AAC.1
MAKKGANNASKKAVKRMVKKTTLAKKTGAKTSTTKSRRGQALAKKTGAKTNRRGQTDPLLGSGW